MAVRRIDDSALTAIANAIRAKTGSTETMKVGDMPTEIAAIAGSSLPSGITVGSFTRPSPNPAAGNFTVAHGLGKVPRAVLVWKATEQYLNTFSGMVCLSHETTCRLFNYDGADCTEVTGSVSSSLTASTFLVPSASGSSASSSVWIGTYNWAAIG